MKKTAVILAFSLLLCGCAQTTDAPESSTPEKQYQTADEIFYKSTDEFLASEFCQTMKDAGYTTYMISYPEDQYIFSQMYSSARFYVFCLKETATDSSVNITIQYNTHEEKAEDFAANKVTTEGDILTTAEKDGENFEIYIHKTPYIENDAYNLNYIPFPEYTVGINTNRSTPEAVLEDFQSFTLVPAE